MADLQLDLNQSLDLRIAQFKNDPEKMADVNDFLNEIFEKAQKEADRRSSGGKKGKLDALGIQNGTKKIGAWSNRAKSSARTFATRIFTTICNCTNTVRSTLIARNNSN
ncbi:uncharacterized protein LOC115881401 isoform X2 [Sitophilus oryzae]|uniref:Uncharacterized protein LOC115881401 isoform X2 n=1 Tax=Sitophilus oryzae TaxID=7048 RepID=A0A6J2XUL4_SITOR|nr:uncharacterized protein LOC115881401 isoform X2 [Sitophilus oryzae]